MVLDAQGVNARVKAFDNSHGNFVCVDGWVLFEDGAQREKNPLGRLMEPPADPLELARKIEWYWQVRLDLAVDEFDCYKSRHLFHAKTSMRQQMASAPLEQTPEVVKHLKELKKKVRTCQRKLEVAEEAIEQHKPQRLRDMEEQNEQYREAADSLISEIENIEI
jgi:hypothetical protein